MECTRSTKMSMGPGHNHQASSLPSYRCPFPLSLSDKYSHICLHQIKYTSSQNRKKQMRDNTNEKKKLNLIYIDYRNFLSSLIFGSIKLFFCFLKISLFHLYFGSNFLLQKNPNLHKSRKNSIMSLLVPIFNRINYLLMVSIVSYIPPSTTSFPFRLFWNKFYTCYFIGKYFNMYLWKIRTFWDIIIIPLSQIKIFFNNSLISSSCPIIWNSNKGHTIGLTDLPLKSLLVYRFPLHFFFSLLHNLLVGKKQSICFAEFQTAWILPVESLC